jgi:subtilisin family serine protease
MRRSLALVLAPLAAACALAPSAAAMQRNSALSPQLVELAKPSVQNLPHAAQAKRIGVAVEGPGSLVREGSRVLVEVHFTHGAIAGLDALRAAGGRIVAASRDYQTVTVAAPPDALHGLTDVGGVGSVNEVRAPIVYGVGAECEGGSVISEGAGPPRDQLHVAEARSKYGVDGSGVMVGVLSDSYDKATKAVDGKTKIATHASEDVKSGDLPGPVNSCASEKTPVNVIEDLASSSEATDEGRGMLQIVHDVAPAANLAFATAYGGETAFAKNIEKLKEAGAKVIVDDVGYFEEPFFQEGPVAAAVDKVASEGVSYFSAAGNDNLFEGENEVASWEAPSFRDTSCPATVQALLPSTGKCMDFDPGGGKDNTFGITVEAGETLTVDLQWAEPWYGVHADLDAYLLGPKEELLEKEDQDNVASVAEGGTQKPAEVLQWKNEGLTRKVQLAINRCFEKCNPMADPAKKPRLKLALLENGAGVTETEYPKSLPGDADTFGPTIFGHTAAAGAVSVAAIRYKTNEEPEEYSSRGPVIHLFGPVNGKTAAAAIPEAVIQKPDLTATDCGATTFFANFVSSEATWRFCGTSAAAPHAAGVAALELDANPALEPEEVREAQTENATPIGSFGADAVGAGLLDADATLGSLLPSTVTITKHPAGRTKETTPTFEFTVSPPASLTCSIDGSSPMSCTSPYTVPTPLGDGSHTFEAKASGGNKASFTFTVDTTPPTASFVSKPGSLTSSATPTFAFDASEPSAFTCSLDAAPTEPCVSPYTVPARLSDGPHTFSVTPTDQAGNEGAPVETEFTVDTVAPVVTFTERPPEFTRETTPAFEFTASEQATFACSLDGGSAKPCTSPYLVSAPLSDGRHTLSVTATDPAGNSGKAEATTTIDTTPPVVTFSKRPPEFTSESAPTFEFFANEPALLRCSIDEEPPFACTSPFVAGDALSDGPHTFEVLATDRTDHVGVASVAFTVDTKRPQTFFRARPPKTVRTRLRKVELSFRFRSSEDGSGFICKVDRGLFRFCNSRIVRSFRAGRHVVEVKAQDEAGNVDLTPAVYRFKVKRVG